MGKMRGDGKAKSRGWVGGVDGGKAGLREGSLGKEDKRVAASAKVRRGWERTMVMAMSDERCCDGRPRAPGTKDGRS